MLDQQKGAPPDHCDQDQHTFRFAETGSKSCELERVQLRHNLARYKRRDAQCVKAEQYTAQLHRVSNIVRNENSQVDSLQRGAVQRASVLQHVSQNVRRLRLLAQLSQSVLSDLSGVSRRMLVAIEAGEKNVSLSTLDRVAEALNVAFSDLIQAPDAVDQSRINELAWAGTNTRSKAVLLAKAVACKEVELWEWTLEPGDQYHSQADADGWSEQLYVFEGCLTLVIDEQSFTFSAGEFYMYASNKPHAYCNEGDKVVRFIRNVVI